MQTLFKNLFNLMRLLKLSPFVISIKILHLPSVKCTSRHQKINFFTTPAFSRFYYLKEQKGIALVVTLLALVLITAMVVEFSYGVYTGTNNLYNWRDSQRLSIMAKSGVNVSQRLLPDWVRDEKFSYPFMELAVENPFEDFSGTITVRIEDETSKFYLNSLINQRGEKNEVNCNLFKRLLQVLSLDDRIADRVLDWIEP